MGESNKVSSISTFSALFSVLFLLWFAGSIGGMIMAAKIQQMGWVAVLLGQYFVVFGLAGLYSEIKGGFRHPIILAIPTIGILVVVCGLFWQFGDDATREHIVAQIPNVACGLFMMIGILLLTGIVYDKMQQKKCTYAVQGKCVEVKWHYSTSNSGRSKKTYCPVYEYYYNGQVYTGSQEIYTNLIHINEGEYREIFINPDKPAVFYEKEMSRAFNGVSLIIGIAFVAVSTFAIYAYNFM